MKPAHIAAVIALCVASVLPGAPARAAEIVLDVTLDTSPQHVRNVWVKSFAEKLKDASQGRLSLRVFEAASKYKDAEAAAAIAQGAIDMAIPQYQLLSRFVPEADLEQLPMFYGVGRQDIYRVVDGPIGRELSDRIAAKLQVKVLGRPIDLGFGTVFSTRTALSAPKDLAGMKVRVPGGPATIQRYKVMGAAPVQVAWPDVPQALQTGTISALWSTQESVASAKLWDAGVRYAMEDRQAIVQYLPIVSQAAWKKLPADLQELLVRTWEGQVDGQRELAAKRQADARAINASHGIKTVDPDPAALAAMRERLVASQPELVKQLRMDPSFVARVQAALPR